jgi:hypothetical protein
MRIVSDSGVEKMKTHVVYSVTFVTEMVSFMK